jgi:DNA repair exonuclease SbcCD ATPase subunit
MIERQKRTLVALIASIAMAPIGARAQAPEAGKLDRVVNERVGADEAARASQQRIEQLDDETQKMLTEYRKAISDTESYTRYAEQLTAQIGSQTDEISAIDQQLREVETTSREVAPLMQKMLATLGDFVSLDVPFLVEERTKRVAALEAMMPRADVTFSEKYRRILEAYQVEMEYGRTIEAYEAKLGADADARTVQFLRVGRVALLYQTLDGKETGYWDARQKQWVVDDAYGHAFKEGVAVAKKLRAPELLIVPVPAPKESAS